MAQAFQPVNRLKHRLESLCHTSERRGIVMIGGQLRRGANVSSGEHTRPACWGWRPADPSSLDGRRSVDSRRPGVSPCGLPSAVYRATSRSAWLASLRKPREHGRLDRVGTDLRLEWGHPFSSPAIPRTSGGQIPPPSPKILRTKKNILPLDRTGTFL